MENIRVLMFIGFGSFIGGVVRYLLSKYIHLNFFSFISWGTFIVNVLGCLLIGIVSGYFDRGRMSEEWRQFIAIGILGGFTTFSAFSNETLFLLRNGQSGPAFCYVLLTVLVGLCATFLGYLVVNN